MTELMAFDITSGRPLPHGVTKLLTVLSCELPTNMLGYYRPYTDAPTLRDGLDTGDHPFGVGDHIVWVHRRCSRRQLVETLLHEVFHYLLGHTGTIPAGTGPRFRAQHEAIEELCVRVAAEVLAIEELQAPIGRESVTLAARSTSRGA